VGLWFLDQARNRLWLNDYTGEWIFTRPELRYQRCKNPIFVHFKRETQPGFHNRSHRKAISNAWYKYLLDQITNIDPWETPWIWKHPKITDFICDIVPNVMVEK